MSVKLEDLDRLREMLVRDKLYMQAAIFDFVVGCGWKPEVVVSLKRGHESIQMGDDYRCEVCRNGVHRIEYYSCIHSGVLAWMQIGEPLAGDFIFPDPSNDRAHINESVITDLVAEWTGILGGDPKIQLPSCSRLASTEDRVKKRLERELGHKCKSWTRSYLGRLGQ